MSEMRDDQSVINNQELTSPGCFRQLLGNEVRFLGNPLTNAMLNTRITGHISENQLRSALNKVQLIHPLIRSRVSIDKNLKAWFHTDNVPEPFIRVKPRTSNLQWIDEVRYEQLIPFDFFTGPLIRFVLLTSPEVSDLIIFCHHTICDGMSLTFLIKDILMYLDDPLLETRSRSSPPLLIPENCPEKITEIFLTMINEINEKWRVEARSFNQEDFRNLHKEFWRKHTPRILLLELSESKTKFLFSICKEKSVSVNSALCTAFLAGYYNVCGSFKEHQQKVTISVNLRNYMNRPVGEVFCPYYGAISFKFSYNPEEQFWENSRKFHQAVQKEINAGNMYGAISLYERLDPMLITATNFAFFYQDISEAAVVLAKSLISSAPGMIGSNLGKIEIPEKYKEFQLERMFFVPSAGNPALPLSLGTITIGNKLTCTIPFIEEVHNSVRMEKIRNETLNILGLTD